MSHRQVRGDSPLKPILVSPYGGLPTERGLDPGYLADPIAYCTRYATAAKAVGCDVLLLHMASGAATYTDEAGTIQGTYAAEMLSTLPQKPLLAMMTGQLRQAIGMTLHLYGGTIGIHGQSIERVQEFLYREVMPLMRWAGASGYWFDNTGQSSPEAGWIAQIMSAHGFSYGFEPREQGGNPYPSTLIQTPYRTLTMLSEYDRNYKPGVTVPTGGTAYLGIDDPKISRERFDALKALRWVPIVTSAVVDLAPEKLAWF